MSWSLLVLTNPWKSWGCVEGSTGSVKIEQLCIHDWPIGQPSCQGVFMESFVICKPNPSTKLIACTVLDLSDDGERQLRWEKHSEGFRLPSMWWYPLQANGVSSLELIKLNAHRASIEAWSRSWPSLPLKVLTNWQLFHFVIAKQVWAEREKTWAYYERLIHQGVDNGWKHLTHVPKMKWLPGLAC